MLIFYAGLFFLLFGRMTYIQWTGKAEGEALAAMAEKKYFRSSMLQASRGSIIDRNGELIATDTLSYTLAAVLDEKQSERSVKLRHVADPERTAEVLSKHLPIEKAVALEILTRKDKKQVEFGKAGRDISYETFLAIEKEELPGVHFLEGKKRLYPNGNFASYLVGFTIPEDDGEGGEPEVVGKMGLERTFNKELNGSDGKIDYKADKWGYTLPKAEKAIDPAKDGYNIQLSIDKTIQNFVEDAMTEVDKEYSPERMLAVVANPETGAILAMSQRPSFDPNDLSQLTTNWLNEVVENTIEPGSTMKMFTLAAAIEEGKWDPYAYSPSGRYTLYDRVISDHNRTGWGTITFLEGFQRSSNVSIAYLRERLGDEALQKYFSDFKFGEKTGIDLPNEASGILLANNPIERLTTAYGQGSTVTPIQMIQAATAIANDGEMMRPYVIEKIEDPNEEKIIRHSKKEQVGTPISKETAAAVRDILASTVTSDVGTGQKFELSDYTLAGKTGTAEIPRPKGAGYLSGHGNYLYSFLGMAPAENPELIAYVYIQQPKLKQTETGSDPVAKLFKTIMQGSLKYLNIVPQDEHIIEPKKLGNYIGKKYEEALPELEQAFYKPIVIGEGGKVTAQYPAAGTKLGTGSTVIMKTEGSTSLPDFTGWSKKTLLSYKMLSSLDIRISGHGYVVEQSQSTGTIAQEGEPIVIKLRMPAEVYNLDDDQLEADELEETEELQPLIGG